MDETRDHHTKKDRERKISYNITYMWNLKKNNTNEFTYKAELDSQIQKTNLWLPKKKEVKQG